MASGKFKYDIELTTDFTNYFQDVINSAWEDPTQENPIIIIRCKVGNIITLSPFDCANWDPDNLVIIGALSTQASKVTMEMVFDESEENPPVLTGHLLIVTDNPNSLTADFEILAVREEDFTPEVS